MILFKSNRFYFTISLVLIISLFYNCNSSNSDIKSSDIVIAGKTDIIDTAIQLITVQTFDLLNHDQSSFLTFVDSNGFFKIRLPLSHSQGVYIEHYCQTTAYLNPGDSIYISFKKSFKDSFHQQNNSVVFSGDNAIMNNLIAKYIDDFKKLSFEPILNNITLAQYKLKLSSWNTFQLQRLDSFCLENNASHKFKEYAKSDLTYKNANFLIDYTVHCLINNLPIDNNLFDIASFPIDNDNALHSYFYRAHLNQYLIFKYLADTSLMNKNEEDILSKYKFMTSTILQNEKKSLSRNIIICDIIGKVRKEIPNDSSFNVFLDFAISKISNKDIKQAIRDKYSTIEKQNDFFKTTNLKDSDLTNIIEDIKNKYLGKVIYIDIYTTWCGPCRAQIPYSIKLKDYYKNSDVVFLYFCLKSDRIEFENFIKNMKTESNQYYFNKLQSNLLMQQYSISGFPTYLLLNKKGLLVNADAPSPSDQNIIKELDRLLSQ